ncbi:MAG: YicC/YloC family endoribonuclease, partial [Candidatus Omnitrophota bacterium]
MLIGMTGFGRAQFKDKEIEITLQMRSVNHRFFDVAFHLPHNLIYLEEPIKKYLRRRLYRGRITLNLFVAGNLPATINVNEALAKQYIVALRRRR